MTNFPNRTKALVFPVGWSATSLVLEMTPQTSVPANVKAFPRGRPCWFSLFGLFGTVPVEFSAFRKAWRTGNMALIGPRLALLLSLHFDEDRVRPSPTDAHN